MNRIKIHDKYFEPFITAKQLDEVVENLADKLNLRLAGKTPLFVSILNGSFIFAADLLKKINLSCEISFVKMASYSGTSTTENVRELIGFDENLAGKTIVILEDIVDSGITLKKILEILKQSGAAEVIVVALLLKPEAFRMDFEIDYIGMKIPNDFIVGYGMDYDRLGRNLKDIYRIVE